MGDKLIKMDYDRGKVVVARTSEDSNGIKSEEIIELDLPNTAKTSGFIRRVKRDEEGKLYEIEETLDIPVLKKKG